MIKSSDNHRFTFVFFFALLIGAGYNTYVHYDFTHTSIDCLAYLNVANGNFQDATITHRYRILVPFMAKIVSLPIDWVYSSLWPHRSDGQWPLRLSFYIVNSCILALAFTLLFKWLRSFIKIKPLILLLACAALASGRWYNYMAGLPLTDSLYVLVVVLLVLAIQQKSWRLTLVCIFLGPWSKESFLFLAPLLFFYGPLRIKQIPFWLVSGVIVFGARYMIDQAINIPATQSIQEYSGHFGDFIYTFKKLASVRGLGELFTVMGVFTFVVIAVWSNKLFRKKIPVYVWWLLPIFIFHAFLSGEAARMLAFATPLWGVSIALGFDKLAKKLGYY